MPFPHALPVRAADEVPRGDAAAARARRPATLVACHWAEQIKSGQLQPHEVETVFDPGLPAEVYEPPPV